MSDLEQFGEWIATLAVAAFVWVSGALAIDLPVNSTVSSVSQAPAENQHSMMMSWAQQSDEPPIEQVGEDAGGDVEPLDEAGPPAVEAEPNEDIELLDQGDPPAIEGDDIELLDQGAPPVVVNEAPAPATVAGANATTYVAPEPAAARGPVLPEGFGTGSVHVAAGTAGFPVGLADCHVGAVTGRAYVGIDCGDGSTFVGHAPTFENFPFVLDENFPFAEGSVFADRGVGVDEFDENVIDDGAILVSALRGAPLDDDTTAPVIRTTGNSSVEFTQRARDREARVGAETGGSRRSKDADKGAKSEVDAVAADDSDNRTRADGKDKKQKRDKGRTSRASAGDKEKKSNNSKSSKKSKKQGGKKGQKSKRR